jgi:hypothetical protein
LYGGTFALQRSKACKYSSKETLAETRQIQQVCEVTKQVHNFIHDFWRTDFLVDQRFERREVLSVSTKLGIEKYTPRERNSVQLYKKSPGYPELFH